MNTHRSFAWLFVVTTLLSSCALQKNSQSSIALQNKKIPLFIQIPQNPLAFDDVSSLIYTSLHQHCTNVGYVMIDHASQGYTLRIRVKGLDPQQKLVSPDIVLMHAYVTLDLDCELLNFNQESVTQKHFTFSGLVSKPQNPVLVSDCTNYAYQRLLSRTMPKIERHFRPFLLAAFD